MDASGGPVFQSPAREDEKMAPKPPRRVSFADTATVHTFVRDEDFETPPEERHASPSPSPGRSLGSEGDETEGEEGFAPPPFGFLGDVDLASASPASTAGSFSSFDGDGNFFGAVSTSFIQSGRPSDSGISEDDYHDVTLDPRTFSRHYNSVIPPDDCSAHSAGSLMIPNSESTTPLKEPEGPESVKSTCGQDGSTDMSLCAENCDRYDYTKLSPTLNNLLQEVQEPESPKDGANFVTSGHALTLPSSETKHREENSYIGNGVSSGELGNVSSLEEQSTMHNPVCSTPDLNQEDNAMRFNIHDKSRIRHEASEVRDTLGAVLALDSLPNPEHNSHMDLDCSGRKRSIKENGCAEHQLPEKRAKGARSPATSRNQLPCVSLSSRMAEESQSGAHDSGQSLSDDWNKVGLRIASSKCMAEENPSGAHDTGQSSSDDWNKAVLTVSNSLKQMKICPASISKLNLQQLDMLGDMLEKIHLATKYKRLSAAVRNPDPRLAEARSLHEKLLYEKAKLQINRVKLDKLRKKEQLCQVGLQECMYLKSKISQLRRPTAGATQVKGGPLHAATLIDACDRQEGHARITEKKLALSMCQQKVENLKSSLEHFCNAKGDIGEVMRIAEEHLEMRKQCLIISQQASLWVLDGIVKRDNKRDVYLNYRNLLVLRITLNLSDMSTIFVNNSLMGTKIEQKFPNLNAPVAFNFVFKAENQSLSDLRSLQKKTTETSLLLGNLIEVLEEIEDAKGELLNLTSADFGVDSQTVSAGQLIFSVRFISYTTAKRVAFTIDMTDLSRAVYTSEPSELPINVCQAQTTLSQPSLDKLMASIRDLQPGRLMILRLCQTVSRQINELPG